MIFSYTKSHADRKHQAISNRDDDSKSHDTAGNPAGDEMLDAEIALARLGDFHHDGSYTHTRTHCMSAAEDSLTKIK